MPNFTDLIDLAAERVGGRTLHATDEFFAPKENLLKPGRGVFLPEKYTDDGKWMDGWESRRKRVPGHDWCVIKLGMPGRIRGFDIDTNHFLGNYPEHASVEGAHVEGDPSAGLLETAAWEGLLPISRLEGGSRNLFEIADSRRWTHLRLHIYPDGGVARFRVHGEVLPHPATLEGELDLASIRNGAVAILASDMFFSHKNNLIMPGRSTFMGDGWETKRKRGPGHDWIIVRLADSGRIRRIEVDTNHFKGNFPESCSVEGCQAPGTPDDFMASRSLPWTEILPRTKLEAHKQHYYEAELLPGGPYTHLRLNIFPDGGISRLRVHGTLV